MKLESEDPTPPFEDIFSYAENIKDHLSNHLLIWFNESFRVLPWRISYDPYQIWISEVMLQQTQVKTVIPYFQRFMDRFPTIKALAQSKEDELLSLWSGLGYYSRARNLKRSAEIIVEQHQGQMPCDLNALLKLPGIGQYTAGAIMSIAFNRPYPILDGNISRLLARIFAISQPLDNQTKKILWKLTEKLIPNTEPRIFNQALMEFGALVCTPKGNGKNCNPCVLKSLCQGYQQDLVHCLPNNPAKRKREQVIHIAIVISNGEEVLLTKRRDKKVLKNMWELPTILHLALDFDPLSFPKAELKRLAKDHYNIDLIESIYVTAIKHSITYRDIQCHIYQGKVTPAKLLSNHETKWIHPKGLKEIPHSSLIDKILDQFTIWTSKV